MRQQSIKVIAPLSRGLPKTGQTVSYQSGDDGNYEAGWWLGLLNANNRTRFIVKTISGDDVVIDLATGLMWARDGNKDGCGYPLTFRWADAVDYFTDFSFAGFSDWRLPNILELLSIVNWGVYNPSCWDIFTNVHYDLPTWTSTTRSYSTTYAKSLSFSEGSLINVLKTNLRYLRGVRGCI